MPGSSCEKCIFAQWEGQSQNDCALRRLDKFETATIINDDYTGSYRVVPDRICTAKRTKAWLKDHPRNPVQQVREELFPKLQLIVLIDEVSEAWKYFFVENDFSKYSAVDVLVFKPEMDFIRSVGNMISYANVFSHACLPVEHSLCSLRENHINNFVRKDCQFYVLADDPSNRIVSDWPEKLDDYLNGECKSVLMAADLDENGNTIPYNNMLIYSPLHVVLGGYGSQRIDEKLTIHAKNHNQEHLIRYTGEILEEKNNESTTFST